MIYYTNGTTKEFLDRDELIQMADTMSDAFIGHYNWVSVIKNQNKRKIVLNNLFLTMFSVINQFGHTVVVSNEAGESIGYITYMLNRDKEQVSLKRIIKVKALKSGLQFLFGLNLKELIKMSKFERYVDEFYDLDEGLHLYSTGIDPKYRGKGYMGKAFRYAASVFKNEHPHISLETTDPSNLPIYNKLGFKEIETVNLGDDQNLYFMRLSLV